MLQIKPLLITTVFAISLTVVARVTAQMAMITAMLLAAVVSLFVGGFFGCGRKTPRRRFSSLLGMILLLSSDHYCKAATIADQAEYQACLADPTTCTQL